MGKFVVPQPSVISEVWLQCLLCVWGVLLPHFPPVVTWSGLSIGVAAVASASGVGVQLCPSALDGESATLVLLRRLRLASAPPCHFRARFAGRRLRWGVPAARSSRSLLVH